MELTVEPLELNMADSAKSSIWGNTVRIRSTPDRTNDDNIVGRARKEEELAILEEKTNDDGERWLRIRMANFQRQDSGIK